MTAKDSNSPAYMDNPDYNIPDESNISPSGPLTTEGTRVIISRVYDTRIGSVHMSNFPCNPALVDKVYRRKLRSLGLRLLALTAKRKGIPITAYTCVDAESDEPPVCDDLTYTYLDKYHVIITTALGDRGELEVSET